MFGALLRVEKAVLAVPDLVVKLLFPRPNPKNK